MNVKKPKVYSKLKIIGFVFSAIGIFGFVLSQVSFGDFSSNNFMLGGMMATIGLFIGLSSLLIGFTPEISKTSYKTARYIQSENKEDLTDIANTSADISKDAVKTIVKSVKEGFNDSIYCKHCGAAIDSDSRFCKSCGKEQ